MDIVDHYSVLTLYHGDFNVDLIHGMFSQNIFVSSEQYIKIITWTIYLGKKIYLIPKIDELSPYLCITITGRITILGVI